MEIPSGQFPDSGKYQGKKEYGWYPEKKWLILAFLNKKALCKSVASWSPGKAGKAGAILLVFALQKPFALPQEASHSGNKHSGRIILLSEIPDIIFPRRFFPILVEQPVILTQAIGLPGLGMPPVMNDAGTGGGFQQILRL